MPFQGIEERVDHLDSVLAKFIETSDQAIARIDRDIEESRQWRLQSQKEWGALAQKLGTFVEDVVAPNIPHLAREHFGLNAPGEVMFSAPRVRLRHPVDPSKVREFDYLYATTRGWIVVESKNDPKLKDVDDFREMLAEIRDYFPQYQNLPLWPIFASLYLADHIVKYCTRYRIYALGLGPETMQLLNLGELPPSPVA